MAWTMLACRLALGLFVLVGLAERELVLKVVAENEGMLLAGVFWEFSVELVLCLAVLDLCLDFGVLLWGL